MTAEDKGLDRADADWFKSAVFYEVLIRSFRDSSGDGVGDLQGLTEKLDYLEWLGVDCLWLPPFFPSPLKDGGYDVADYTAVGRGSFYDLGGSNPSVLSYLREHDDDVMLCVNNLSRFPQPVELDLHQFQGSHPVEMLGGVEFPAIGELPYLLTLPGYGFYCFRINRPTVTEGSVA